MKKQLLVFVAMMVGCAVFSQNNVLVNGNLLVNGQPVTGGSGGLQGLATDGNGWLSANNGSWWIGGDGSFSFSGGSFLGDNGGNINVENVISNEQAYQFINDGSGFLSNGNINWDDRGNLWGGVGKPEVYAKLQEWLSAGDDVPKEWKCAWNINSDGRIFSTDMEFGYEEVANKIWVKRVVDGALGNNGVFNTVSDDGNGGLYSTYGNWSIDGKGNLIITNIQDNSGGYGLNDDGTGMLASGNISWDNLGNLSTSVGNVEGISSTTTIPTPTSTGTKGEVRVIGNYRYDCIASNTWVRTDVTTSW